ncbi:MAG: hypothetical protein WAK97_01690 [Pseudolabrys sp.]
MQLFAQFQKEIISLAFTLISAGILYLFRARAKLVWGTPYGFTFLIHDVPAPTPVPVSVPAQQDAPQTPAPAPMASNIQTASLIVQNNGREPATEVEVTFNWKPHIYNIWPIRPYDIHTSPDTRFTLKFPNLAPKEFFQVELISPGSLPQIMSVRCKECVGKYIPVRPMRVWPNWVYGLIWSVMLLGVSAIVYFILKVGALVFAT